MCAICITLRINPRIENIPCFVSSRDPGQKTKESVVLLLFIPGMALNCAIMLLGQSLTLSWNNDGNN